MIISRTPYRISFFGGGTDYPAWFQEHGGAVLATTIDKYCYITARYLPPFFEHRSRIVWSKIETVTDNIAIEHPVVRAALNHLGIDDGIEIHHVGDLPARTGVGSSSSFTVALLAALHTLRGRAISRQRLAEQAIHVEQRLLKENVGVQDQITATYGGLNVVEIGRDGQFVVQPVILPQERLEAFQSRLLLVYTGVARFASEVAASKIAAIPKKTRELEIMRSFVDTGLELLTTGDLNGFGELLHETWMLKRSLSSKVSAGFVDEIYDAARQAGATGGKLLGAGGGGFLLLYVEPSRREAVREALKGLLEIPFRFEREGNRILYYDAGAIGPGEAEPTGDVGLPRQQGGVP